MKTVLLVLDGIADEPIESLERKTPLEVAKTPNLKALAQTGLVGRLVLSNPRTGPTEESTCIGVLGYEPTKALTARGSLSASSIELKMTDNEWILACRLVTESDGRMIDARAGWISDRETAALYEALNRAFKGRGMRFYAGGHRCHVLTIPASDVFAKLGELDLRGPEEMLGRDLQGGWAKSPAGSQIRAALNDAAEILEAHEINKVRVDLNENPANSLWVWGAGKSLRLDPFCASQRPVILSTSDVWTGAARAAGIPCAPALLTPQPEPGELAELSARLLDFTRTHDLTILHLAEADRSSLAGDYKKKIRWIEAFDQHLIGALRERFAVNPGARIAVASGHVTSTDRRERTSGEAPFLLWGGSDAKPQTEFTEEASAQAGGNAVTGTDFLKKILSRTAQLS